MKGTEILNCNDKIDENSFYDLLILYGSQTGTAKFAAEELQRELFKLNFISKINEMDSYNCLNLPEENFIIFIISTTGYGEFPSNSKNFWNFLMRKDLPEDSLENINYTVFGLGDSSYEKFNQCAKLLNSRLSQLSANLFHPVALGDDQHDFGYEAEFDPWLKSVVEELVNYYPEKNQYKENNRNLFDFFINKVNFEVHVVNKQSFENENIDKKEAIKKLLKKYYKLKENDDLKKWIEDNRITFIKENEIITSEDSFKKVFNIKLEISNNNKEIEEENNENTDDFDLRFNSLINNKLIEKINLEVFNNFADDKIKNFTKSVKSQIKDIRKLNNSHYHHLIPGDSALIFPENDIETISKFMKIVNLKKDDYLIFEYKNDDFRKGFTFPYFINAYEFVKKWLNINGYPNRFFCYIAYLFTEEPIYREKLELFTSKSSVNVFYIILFNLFDIYKFKKKLTI